MSEISLSFHGGAGWVTGACYLLKARGKSILIDCGLIQGGRFAEKKNHEPFGFDPASIDALFVTHAHLDHVGRIPKLVKEGFRGAIYSTAPTRDLAELMMKDGASLMAYEAETHHEEPLYNEADIKETMRQWRALDYRKEIDVGDIRVMLFRAGHILGSAMVSLKAGEKQFLFTGDLGSRESLLLPPADEISAADYLIIESAYGDRMHPQVSEATMQLERAVEDVAERQGTLMIPSFATERTQDILYLLNEMLVHRHIPEMPIFVDSPLAIKVTEVFEKYRAYYNDGVQELMKEHPHLFEAKSLRNTPSVEESKHINDIPPPKVIVAGSGMMTGGRILHHMRRYLPDAKSTLMIVGYQVPGSLGRQIMEGAGEVIIFGESVPVRAHIVQAHGFSAHADEARLFEVVEGLKDSLQHVFAVQGEMEAASAFTQKIKDRLGILADVPAMHQKFFL